VCARTSRSTTRKCMACRHSQGAADRTHMHHLASSLAPGWLLTGAGALLHQRGLRQQRGPAQCVSCGQP
jgi:hypothetical protein